MERRGRSENSDSFEQVGPVVPFSFNINVLFTGHEQCDRLHFAGPCYKKTYLLHIVESGKGMFRCNGKEYRLKKGDMFLITPTDYIFYQADDEEPWEYRWIKFSGSSLQYLFENAGITKSVFSIESEEQFNEAETLFKNIFDYMHDEISPYLRATGAFYVLLGWFLNSFGEVRTASADRMGFVKILNYLNSHFTEDINMDTIAEFSNYNRSHIYKLFIKNMGCSPKEYISTLRLNLACEMLRETNYSVNEVSIRTGFNSYVSFVNAFKKKYGILPTQFRKNEECVCGEDSDARGER